MSKENSLSSKSVSIVIPAYNEEANLAGTIDSIDAATKEVLTDFEILIVDDCSRDQTLKVAQTLAAQNPAIKVIHHETNQGFGGAFRTGLAHAVKQSVIIIPGDNEIAPHSIRAVFLQAGKADIVIPFTSNKSARSPLRRFISFAFTESMNLLFGLRLKYYNGICLLPRQATQDIGVATTGFAYMAQILVKLIKLKQMTYVETGMEITPQKGRKTKAFSFKNITSVLFAIYDLKRSVSRSLKAEEKNNYISRPRSLL